MTCYKHLSRLLLAGHLVTGLLALPAAAQDDPFSITTWGNVYEVPVMREVTLRADVPYLSDAQGRLALDLYLPPRHQTGDRRPAVVFVNAIGDGPGNKVKDWGIYRTWPRLVAAHGLVGIAMEADGERVDESLRAVFDFLARHGAEHGIDGGRVGIYAASANVTRTAALLLGEDPPAGVRAAVLYYGQVPPQALRTDLPVLFVVAESDAPGMGEALNALWTRVVDAQAPWTLVYGSDLPHAFDAVSDNDDARRLIQQTIGFWKSHLEPVPTPSWEPSPVREVWAAVYGHTPQQALERLTPLMPTYQDHVPALQLYANLLQQLQRYDEASATLEQALELEPDNAQLYATLGGVRMHMQRWEEAADLLQRALDGGVNGGYYYGQLAYTQLHLGRNEDAVRNYETALEMWMPPQARQLGYYNLACGYTRLGRNDQAFEALTQALDAGYSNLEHLQDDPDFDTLRDDPRYQTLLARLRPGETP